MAGEKNQSKALTLFLLIVLALSAGWCANLLGGGWGFAYGSTLSWLALAVPSVFGGLALLSLLRSPRLKDGISRIAQSITTRFGGLKNVLMLLLFIWYLLGLGLATPTHQLGRLAPYLDRLRPAGSFLFYLMAIALAFAFISCPPLKAENRKENRNFLIASALCLGVCLVLWALAAWSGIGLQQPEELWDEGGVPLLAAQVWGVGGLVFFGGWLAKRFFAIFSKWQSGFIPDLILCLVLAVSAAFLWISTPLEGNYFIQGPYNIVPGYLPYSDALNWDIGGQFALIGQGIANRDPFADHTAYMAFLAFLHLLAGNNFALLAAIQSGIYAIFVVIVYWIGRSLHSRSAGVLLAGLLLLREANGIRMGHLVTTSHSRLLMTEVPIAIGVGLLVLLLVQALRDERHGRWLMLPAGAICALMILTRLNALVLPVAVAGGLLVYPNLKFRQRLQLTLAYGGSLLLSLAGWMARTWRLAGTPFFFLGKSRLLLSGRFRAAAPLAPSQRISFGNTIMLAIWQAAAPLASGAVNAMQAAAGLSGLVFQTVNHFMHNLATSVVSLPLIPFSPLALSDIVTQAYPFWNANGVLWRGEMSWLAAVGLIFNLAIIALGVGRSWQRMRFAGLAPLFIMLAYFGSTAVARTSGGRYIVPADWVLVLYFSIGLAELAIQAWRRLGEWKEGAANSMPSIKSKPLALALFVPMAAFLVGMLALDQAVPQRFAPLTAIEAARIQQSASNNETSEADLQAFLAGGGELANGMLLYPRFYQAGQVGSSVVLGGELAQYARLEFTLLGPQGERRVVLPVEKMPEGIQQGSVLIAIGCPQGRSAVLLADSVFIGEGIPQLFNSSIPLTDSCEIDYMLGTE